MNDWSFDNGSRFLKLGDFTHHVGGFARELDSTGYTRLTILGYVISIAHFSTWARTRRLTIKDINEELVSEFGTHRCRCPGSRRWQRVSRKYARRVRRFVRYLERQGIVVKRQTPAVRYAPSNATRDRCSRCCRPLREQERTSLLLKYERSYLPKLGSGADHRSETS